MQQQTKNKKEGQKPSFIFSVACLHKVAKIIGFKAVLLLRHIVIYLSSESGLFLIVKSFRA